MLPTALQIVALILAIIILFQSKITSLCGWAIAALALSFLLGVLGGVV